MSWSYEHNERKEPYIIHFQNGLIGRAVGAYRNEIWVRLMQRLKQKQQLGSTLQSKYCTAPFLSKRNGFQTDFAVLESRILVTSKRIYCSDNLLTVSLSVSEPDFMEGMLDHVEIGSSRSQKLQPRSVWIWWMMSQNYQHWCLVIKQWTTCEQHWSFCRFLHKIQGISRDAVDSIHGCGHSVSSDVRGNTELGSISSWGKYFKYIMTVLQWADFPPRGK